MSRGKIHARGSKKRQEKPIIVIIPEGSETEPAYFRHFNSRDKNIKVEVIENSSNGAATDYAALMRKAAKYKSDYQLSPKKGDAVWIVADGDVDYNTPGSLEAKNTALSDMRKRAESAGINVAISNPCFELWYLLHFGYTSGFMKDYDAVKNKLVNFLPEYEKNKDVYDLLYENMDAAIQHAKQLELFHEENGESIPLNPSTNPFTEVYKLIEQIR